MRTTNPTKNEELMEVAKLTTLTGETSTNEEEIHKTAPVQGQRADKYQACTSIESCVTIMNKKVRNSKLPHTKTKHVQSLLQP